MLRTAKKKCFLDYESVEYHLTHVLSISRAKYIVQAICVNVGIKKINAINIPYDR